MCESATIKTEQGRDFLKVLKCSLKLLSLMDLVELFRRPTRESPNLFGSSVGA